MYQKIKPEFIHVTLFGCGKRIRCALQVHKIWNNWARSQYDSITLNYRNILIEMFISLSNVVLVWSI